MDSMTLVVIVGICLVGGTLAGAVAQARGGSFANFFVVGAVLPLVGVVLAAVHKPAARPGWYADPWRQSAYRWHNGVNWTGWTT